MARGAISLPYTTTHLAVVAETGVNRIVIANANADQYVIGQTIGIGTSQGGNQIANNRVVTSIEIYDANNKSINFDGTPINITVGNMVYSLGWKSGMTDNVVATCGSCMTNNGKYPCKFYGIENPWGNVWQWIDGININDYQSYVCSNPTKYADTITSDYTALNYVNANTDGYIKEMGYDSRYPYVKITTTVGAASNTYYCDYYYRTTGLRALCGGGSWIYGSAAGLFCFSAYGAASNASIDISARLSWKTS
jgi:hypothetical protein